MRIDNESKELLRYVSEDFVFYAKESTPVAYHIESGDKIGKESFKHYCAKHYGDVVAYDDTKQDDAGNPVQTRMPLGPIWWEWEDPNRRVVRQFVMEPTSKSEEDDPRSGEVYNLWHQLKKSMVEPNPAATLDDVVPFLNHLMYISDGDEEAVMYFMNWLANLYQKPEEKMPSAILMYSKIGRIGKSMIYKILKQVFGGPLCATSDGSVLNSKFMDAMENKRLVFLNELSRSDKLDSYERFKSLISEEETTFEGKGRAAKGIVNIAHYIITTNHEDALPLMEKDGRIAIFRCLSERKPNSYYAMMHEWMYGPGPAALAQILKTWKFPVGWDSHAPVPQTEAAKALQRASRGGIVTLVEELIDAGRAPFDKDVGTVSALIEQLASLYPQNTKGLNHRSLPSALERLGSKQLPLAGYTTKDGKKTSTRCWCWRNHDKWIDATGQDIATELGLL